MQVVIEQAQTDFPEELYPVTMFALAPASSPAPALPIPAAAAKSHGGDDVVKKRRALDDGGGVKRFP
jgi:hypothetical protein